MTDARRIVFATQDFEALLRRFAETLPRLLLQHPATADLAFQIDRLHLTEALASRFTVAIIGQMRVGKSTLLNALIGRKLAPTGTTETTATINWFRYGTGDLCHKFRVHWHHGGTEEQPLAAAAEWVGTKENAQRTRALDFFADSAFLKTANIVDTPGTRSVLESHEKATRGFLEEQRAAQLEAETFAYGGRADAVVYVINPVAHQADADLLKFFGEHTRLPGASAYNSIAVVQKWEHFPDPLADVAGKCARLSEQLSGKVSAVIATSGLLANTAREVPAEAWAQVAQLATASPQEVMRYITRAAPYFCLDRPGVALDVNSRKALRQAMDWQALCFVIWLAQARRIDDGEALRTAVLEASGIERLKNLLQDRFFSLAGVIQASTVLHRAWEPCHIALLKLRAITETWETDRQLGKQAIDRLAQERYATDVTLAPVQRYLRNSLAAVERELHQTQEIRSALDQMHDDTEWNFRLLDADLACLRALEALEAEVSLEDRLALGRLFGGFGTAVWTRLGLPSQAEIRPDIRDRLWGQHDYWTDRKARASGARLEIYTHAVERLETIMTHLEEYFDA